MQTRIKNWIGLGVLLLISIICMVNLLLNNNQAMAASILPTEFEGVYSQNGGEWMPFSDDVDLSALEGDIILKGHLEHDVWDGARINLLSNHIGVSIYVNGECIYMDARTEVTNHGMEIFPSMCSKMWISFISSEILQTDEVQIHMMNPHTYGNKTAYLDLMKNIYVTFNGDKMMESIIAPYVRPFQVIGTVVLFLAVMLLGAAVAGIFLKSSIVGYVLQLGFLCLFASGYILFDNIFILENEIVIVYTYGRQICMMLTAYMIGVLAKRSFAGDKYQIVEYVSTLTVVIDSVIILMAAFGSLIYDLQRYWLMWQMLVSIFFIFLYIDEIWHKKKCSWKNGLFIALFVAIILDILGVANTTYQQGNISKIMFGITCLIYLIYVVKMIILNQHALVREKKLQAELTEMHIATMLSQIKPHFIYNTLGTIEQFCYDAPQEAAKLVHEFALYLRGNFVELDNAAPVSIDQELEHVKHYVSIEQVRFPDMQIKYDIQAKDFLIPALSIQPLVENAIKHGLMRLEKGGTVEISTYETPDGYCVCVKDDGVGFEETDYADGKKHIGIQNIKARVESMCDGTVDIRSKKGEGTTVIISIPKEENDDSDSSR